LVVYQDTTVTQSTVTSSATSAHGFGFAAGAVPQRTPEPTTTDHTTQVPDGLIPIVSADSNHPQQTPTAPTPWLIYGVFVLVIAGAMGAVVYRSDR
jgi:hypothetical protein